MTSSLIIAVDGPAASGKGSIASRLAALYGLPHLDTGLLYRATGIPASVWLMLFTAVIAGTLAWAWTVVSAGVGLPALL